MTRFCDASANDLRVDVKRSISEIPEQEWDSINARQGLFWTHRFFRTIEQSKVQDASYYYLLFRAGDALVGSAVLSAFDAYLDLLLPPLIQKVSSVMRRVFPSFLRIRILFCGVPISIGKHTLTIAGETYKDQVVTAIHAKMRDIAQEERIAYLCFKEFPEDAVWLSRTLETLGYFRALSIPRITMTLRWTDYSAYVQAMRHGYRRQVRQSLKKLDSIPDTVPMYDPSASHGVRPQMAIIEPGSYAAGPIHDLYMEVMTRTRVKLEVLNREFFAGAFQILGEDLSLLEVIENDVPIAFAVLAIEGPRLSFLLAGFDYTRRDETASYFNLLNGIIMFAFQKGCTQIDLGQTSYPPKLRLGGVPEPMCFYLQSRGRLRQAVLRRLNPILFPPTFLQRPRVFREASGQPDSET